MENNVSATRQGVDCLVKHGSLVYHMIEWCAGAMDGQGRIVVGDSRNQGCDFEALMYKSEMPRLVQAVRERCPRLTLSG